MARTISTASDADYLKAWEEFRENFQRATPVDLYETAVEKNKRIKRLEENPEDWFNYYFPHYCTSEPADFHRESTKIVLSKLELYLIRAWCRELAKSSRSMMEDVYQAMTGQIKNFLLVSNTHGNAELLLLEYKACFETNQRIINDYGKQQKGGSWKSDHFIIRKGCSFRAIGWGESPRGTKNQNKRPDKIRIDDIDTDEECRNEDTQNYKERWVEQALIGTRSISNPCQIVVCGNIIHENCIPNKLKDRADRFELVNIRDENGKSTWPQKNKEEDIDRVLSLISYESAQKEYFNNPMDGGDTFKNLKWGKVPSLKDCLVGIYADPATSNKDKTSNSDKAVGILAKKGFDFYIVKTACGSMTNAQFMDFLFEFYIWCKLKGLDVVPVWMENNKLQDPFYEQVFLPLMYSISTERGILLPITPDTRDKPEKWFRIEGTLEPLDRLGHLYFNEEEKEDPHMKRLRSQFKNASRKSKKLDGPDMVEGGVIKLRDQEVVDSSGSFESFKNRNAKKW